VPISKSKSWLISTVDIFSPCGKDMPDGWLAIDMNWYRYLLNNASLHGNTPSASQYRAPERCWLEWIVRRPLSSIHYVTGPAPPLRARVALVTAWWGASQSIADSSLAHPDGVSNMLSDLGPDSRGQVMPLVPGWAALAGRQDPRPVHRQYRSSPGQRRLRFFRLYSRSAPYSKWKSWLHFTPLIFSLRFLG